jgi:hypothetical protein
MLPDVTFGVNHHVILVSSRQFFAGLLRHCLRSIPLGQSSLALPGALLVLAVGGLRTAELARQIVRRIESNFDGIAGAANGLEGTRLDRAERRRLTIEIVTLAESIRLLNTISRRWGSRSGDESESGNKDRRHTHPRHEGRFSDRQSVVVAASGCRFVLSPGIEGTVRKWQAAAYQASGPGDAVAWHRSPRVPGTDP